ncbi:MAG: SPOR domain-containing protein [Proteobacteria bacterium]|nr:SPOR domain-containing protein [Pseudomonadota bacterium]
MDYKNRFPDNRYRFEEKKSRTGLWVFLAVLVVIISAVAGWAMSRHQEETKAAVQPETPPAQVKANPVTLPDKPGVSKPAKPQTKENQKPGQEANPGAVKAPEPRFTFYKILPEKEAIIPESEIKNLKNQESLSKRPSAAQYLLQVGSFANPQDAANLKSRLSELKIKSHIENVKIENVAWNRVKIGPFKSLADTDKVRTYLRNNQIDSVVQKTVTKPTQTPATPAKH